MKRVAVWPVSKARQNDSNADFFESISALLRFTPHMLRNARMAGSVTLRRSDIDQIIEGVDGALTRVFG